MKRFMFLKVLMLIKQVIVKSVLFILKLFVLYLVLDKGSKFQSAPVMSVIMY